MSKICFAQLLWSVQGETHKGKSSKLLPLLRKNWRLLHRLLSWLPYLFITCCLIWVDSDESTLSLFGNRLGTNKPGGVVCLSSVSCIIEREWWAHSGLYQLQWCLCHLLGSEGQGQKSNFMCDGPNAISAKHSAYEQAVPLGEWWEVTQSNKRKDTPLAACSACPNRRAFSHARKTEKRRFCSWAWSLSHVMIQT